jgi:hypothetical protein
MRTHKTSQPSKLIEKANTNGHLAIKTLKDPVASSYWLFTSPVNIIAITILVVVVTFSFRKKCCRCGVAAQTSVPTTSFASSVLPHP